ncbi:adenylyltransferase/cytidyltransferase family protein [Kangiella shandongensis]|uniref:adenylyltransferase/cytidyltransferase family protein n=1 Tax=Kangiella shandongensis TaxID=2763258 RepID=UPI001CC187CA|nr:adenylyltransferase/cytidyltransferase family protein [Kangiella shandongensis]
MKTVITYGTFDLFHVGHVKLLQRLSDMGSKLVVGCSTDSFNQLKGKRTVYPYQQRKLLLESCRYVDKVFPEENWEQKREDIIRESASLFVMGDDWAGKFDSLSDIVEVFYIPRTPDISTTEIKTYLSVRNEEKDQEIRNLLTRALGLMESK